MRAVPNAPDRSPGETTTRLHSIPSDDRRGTMRKLARKLTFHEVRSVVKELHIKGHDPLNIALAMVDIGLENIADEKTGNEELDEIAERVKLLKKALEVGVAPLA